MENKNTHRLIIAEWTTIIGVFFACFLFLLSEMKSINSTLEIRMQAQEQRTDRLYEMFYEVVRDRK